LRYQGCGWVFDDLEESTSISEELYWGYTIFFELYIVAPSTAYEAVCHMTEFAEAVFMAALGLLMQLMLQ
jgi:hypothetical protein